MTDSEKNPQWVIPAPSAQPPKTAPLPPVTAPPADITPPRAGSGQLPPPPPGTPLPPVKTGPGGPKKPKKPKKKHRVRRVILGILAVMVVYVTALAVVFALAVNKVGPLPPSDVTSSGTNYLLVGGDSREGMTKEEQDRLHTGPEGGGGADTIMLMHVPDFGTPTLVSIPRDSWVDVPNNGSSKINAAYALGGPDLLTKTVEQNTGLHVDHFVEIGFSGVADVADSLGGVRLCPVRDYSDENSGLNVKAGCQLMDGPTSLAYVRMRYADPEGDLGRVKRQQEFIGAVVKRAANPITWLLPWRSFGAAEAAGSSLTVDQGTHVWDDAQLGLAMAMVAAGLGDSTTVPTEPDTYYVDGQDALKWNSEQARQLFNNLGA